MKKIITLVLFMGLIGSSTYAQVAQIQYGDINHTATVPVRYKLYQTFNMWTFLKLDTRTGNITQVQYSVNGDEFECNLGSPYRILLESEKKDGRYELYPTTNNWTFILLDQIDGKVYHVQWSQDALKRGVYEIQSISF